MAKTSVTEIEKSLVSLCKLTDQMLWECFDASGTANFSSALWGKKSKLRFPKKDNGSLRISEQEPRFLFCKAIEKKTKPLLLYSVETPTIHGYKFKGETQRTARSDLSLHFGGKLEKPDVNLEFKSGGFSRNSKRLDNTITKDMQKLLKEPGHGLWFQILESTTRGWMENNLGALEEGLMRAQKKVRKRLLKKKNIIFHMCVINNEVSLTKVLDIEAGSSSIIPDGFFLLKDRSGKSVTIEQFGKATQMNGWKVYKY